MAADWIKLRVDLQSHPKIVRILSATKSDKFRAIGGLHAVWSVFDTHSVDGVLDGYSPDALDHVIGWQGFADAMIAVGWLHFDGSQTLSLPEFDEHNGQSAKRRAEDQKRKKSSRKSPQSVRNLSAKETDETRDKVRTREREREEVKEMKISASSPSDAAPTRSDPVPYQRIVDCYNRNMAKLPKVLSVTTKRKTLIRSAWQTDAKWRNAEFWDAYFEECADDGFLNGSGPYRAPHENWRPSFDHLMKTETVAKVFERAMHRMESAQ